MNPQKVSVIGTINRDIIISPQGKRTESLGGILYNVLTLSEIGKDSIRIFPVSHIGSDSKNELIKLLKKHRNIHPDGIKQYKGKTNTNLLTYTSQNERIETTEFYSDNINYEMIEPYLSSRLLLFNLISGFDISRETLTKVRHNSNSIIFMDVHSLVLSRSKKRVFKKIPDWKQWAKSIDIIQMNSHELTYFLGKPPETNPPESKSIIDSIKLILKTGINIVLITSGEKGAYIGYQDSIYFSKQPYKSTVKDTTGCGDIFSAVFIAKYLRSENPLKSCQYANTIAGESTKYKGLQKCQAVNEHLTAIHLQTANPKKLY
jgi:sugar/nucleoside kinase (ribokinase family)